MATVPNAQHIAVSLLARRDHSEYELRQKLAQRQCTPEQIDAAVDYCFHHDWLNDARFAASLLRLGVAKCHGWQRICYDAKRKGIDIALLEQAQVQAQYDWFELARSYALRKFADYDDCLPAVDFAQKAKWMRHLQGRGFSYDEISYALEPNAKN